MRILYHSGSPTINTGYGRATREIATRLHNQGHEVAIQTMKSIQNSPIWWHGEEFDGELRSPIKLYPAGQMNFGISQAHDNYRDWDADFYFTHFDTWMDPARETIPNMGIPYASYAIVDHYPAPEAVVEQVMNAHRTVCMSKFARSALREKGVRATYIPHGINPDNFYPRDNPPGRIEGIQRDGATRVIDPEDTFIIGMVAANHADRKHIPEQMQAFKMFLDRVDEDAILYIHTQQRAKQGFNLDDVQKEIGIPDGNIFVARQEDYHSVGDEFLNGWYNVFDVFLNCARGESWGFTITEAQAAGTPCIVTNFSSMPEQLGYLDGSAGSFKIHEGERGGVIKTHHGIVVEPVMGIFRERVSAKHYIAHPEDIYYALRYYYEHPGEIEEDGAIAADYVRDNYTWTGNVIPSFIDMFEQIEEEVL